jgi:hypothetical protein
MAWVGPGMAFARRVGPAGLVKTSQEREAADRFVLWGNRSSSARQRLVVASPGRWRQTTGQGAYGARIRGRCQISNKSPPLASRGSLLQRLDFLTRKIESHRHGEATNNRAAANAELGVYHIKGKPAKLVGIRGQVRPNGLRDQSKDYHCRHGGRGPGVEALHVDQGCGGCRHHF